MRPPHGFSIDLSEKENPVEILINRDRIQERVVELGKEITEDYDGQKLVLLGVLKGSFVFLSDLCRAIDPNRVQVMVDFLALSSYQGRTESTGEVRVIKDTQLRLSERHVLIVEDIVETGSTFEIQKALLALKSPTSIKMCALLFKPKHNNHNHGEEIDYLGFEIPDKFVVGYGLDLNEYYRNLSYIGYLGPK